MTSPAEPPPVVAPEPSAEWKFEVTGYFRAPLRFSWGPATTAQGSRESAIRAAQLAGTQLRTPPLVPDANYIDWRYTNSFVAPWTELNFKYGNDRVKAQVQIASYNLTDPGYRRLESNLGINQAFITLLWPELGSNENLHLTLTVGGFTNRYGAAGRYDAGKYETYLFGRTHVAGATVNIAYDASDDWTFQVEAGGGAKLEPIPFYGAPGSAATQPSHQPADVGAVPGPAAAGVGVRRARAPGRRLQEGSGSSALHFIDVFANDNERVDGVHGQSFNTVVRPSNARRRRRSAGVPTRAEAAHHDLRRRRQAAAPVARRRLPRLLASSTPGTRSTCGDAIEVMHSFGGWQLHDNYFGRPGGVDPVTGKIDSVLFQYSFSFGAAALAPAGVLGPGPGPDHRRCS